MLTSSALNRYILNYFIHTIVADAHLRCHAMYLLRELNPNLTF